MPDNYGHHYCGGFIVEAEISCGIGERDDANIAVLLPGFTCTKCGEPQLHSDEVRVLETVLNGGPYSHLKHIRITSGGSAPVTAIAV